MYLMHAGQVPVPDALDLRPDVPDRDCFPDAYTCQHCCDRSLGHRGEAKCWGDQRRLESVWIYDENPEARFRGHTGHTQQLTFQKS